MNQTSHSYRTAVATLLLGSALGLQASSITNDLVVHLPFDNDYANVAPSTVTAAPVGAPGFGSGKIGAGALAFSSDAGGTFFNYVTLGTPPELNFGGSVDLTVSMWVKFTTWTGDPAFISNKNWGSGGNVGYVLATAGNGGLQWNFTDGNPRRDYDGPGSTINNGQWHHIAVSFDRDGNALTYIDGQLVATSLIGPGAESLDSGLPTNIGQDGTGAYTDGGSVGIADGMADDVAVWRRALSGFELARIYEFGNQGVKVSDIPDPAGPTMIGTIPAATTDVRADSAVGAVILDGALPLDNNTVQLRLDNASVAFTVNKVGGQTTISHQPAAPFANASTHQVQITFGDGVSPLVTSNWSFTVVLDAQPPGITGQWDFDAGDLNATIGAALDYRGGATGGTAQGTRFGTTTSLGIPDINGIPARVMAMPAATTPDIGYLMTHGARPNGSPDATRVNQWTIIMDVLFPNANGETWFSFIQIDDPNNSNDGDFFARFSGGVAGIGIGGQYPGTLTAGAWHRVAFAVDLTAQVVSKWIDGEKAADQTLGEPLNGRHSLLPTALLFSDEDGESQPAYINSVQIRNYRVSDAGLAALGGPSASGIPRVTGQWDFEAGNLAATIGPDLQLMPGTDIFTVFEQGLIEGNTANVMRWTYTPPDVAAQAAGYIMPHGALPNAGGAYVNQYTLIMDVLFPAASSGTWRGLFQTSTANANDGDLFVNAANGLGISGQYQGNVTADTWHRIAFTFDLTKRELGKYLDGSNVLSGPVGSAPLGTGPFQYLDSGVDGRWSLDPTALLFTDEDGEVNAGIVNSIQFRAEVLSAQQIAILGGPNASGIPMNLPDPPTLSIEVTVFGPTISWPTSFTGYVLQSATRLGPTADWADVDGVGNNLYEEFRPANPAWFYRLIKR